jgi:uncharacterized protein (DUF58 family)
MPIKKERAELLLLALAALLLRGGERVRLLGGPIRMRGGRGALEGIAETLNDIPASDGLPPEAPLPRYARVVLFGDFLSPLPAIRRTVGTLASMPVQGHLQQVLDPAEALLPFSGPIRFQGMRAEPDHIVPRVEGVREGYAEALSNQLHGLADLCTTAGWTFGTHRTDHPPETALLALYSAMAK